VTAIFRPLEFNDDNIRILVDAKEVNTAPGIRPFSEFLREDKYILCDYGDLVPK
jgi:hypothetical protein